MMVIFLPHNRNIYPSYFAGCFIRSFRQTKSIRFSLLRIDQPNKLLIIMFTTVCVMHFLRFISFSVSILNNILLNQ